MYITTVWVKAPGTFSLSYDTVRVQMEPASCAGGREKSIALHTLGVTRLTSVGCLLVWCVADEKYLVPWFYMVTLVEYRQYGAKTSRSWECIVGVVGGGKRTCGGEKRARHSPPLITCQCFSRGARRPGRE
jgi:hypothetical protein